MDVKRKILIVEGDGDKAFFETLFKKIDLEIGIKVNTPKDHDFDRDGKKRAIRLLKRLIKLPMDGTISHLGIVLDADFKCDHWGFEVTLKEIEKILNENGYGNPEVQSGGLAFPHSTGLSLNSIGLWIMPDNASEGMLEDWIKQSVHESETSLLELAIDTIKNLPNKKFKPIRNSKAEVATWMAWQKIPGRDFDGAIDDDLINFQCKSMTQLINWIKHIYTVDSKPPHEFQEKDNPAVCEN